MAVEKRNILLTHVTEKMEYRSSSHPVPNRYPVRDDSSLHATHVREQYDRVYTHREVAAIQSKGGTYAEFSGLPGYELATKSLENRTSGIRLLNVHDTGSCVRATVFIPAGKEDFFRSRIQAYATETTTHGLPKNNDLIRSIETIRLAMVDSFWTDSMEALPHETKINCEVWLRYDAKKRKPETYQFVEEEFHKICDLHGIQVDKEIRLIFPERIVKLICANLEDLKNLIDTCDFLTEFRRAEEPTSFFTSLAPHEQNQWIDDLLSRCTFDDSGVSVCLLDAGINGDHPLLSPAILANGLHAVKDGWGITDNVDSMERGGHGTEMSGIIVYGDLQTALTANTSLSVLHKIESVKVLPNRGQNDRSIYGAITQEAINIAEIYNPDRKRIICMAITSSDSSSADGRPTSWSAALDSITSGAIEEETPHRLFIVSAGNIELSRFRGVGYPEANATETVQNPGQSWNAVTVGAFADKVEVFGHPGFTPLATKGGLSPYSTTSVMWSKWPVKPEVLFAGGNIISNGYDYLQCEELSTLTTGFRPHTNAFSTIFATSAATAQAANYCAQLMSEYPELWPETIRALMIHSASWTDEMHRMFCEKGSTTTKTKRRALLRHCGYGIPSLDRAIQCLSNCVNMIIQGELQPYRKEKSSVRMNEMHFHSLPWPGEVLLQMGNEEVTLHVTLSYFIEPSPGEVGWKNRYRYPSCGLRFEVNHTGESLSDFKARINKLARELDADASADNQPGSRWYLGKQRDVGSIHSDYIFDTAISLYDVCYVAVFPIGGWWKERPYLEKAGNKIRYSLVVSLSTPSTSVDLYTPILNAIEMQHTIAIPIEV